MNILVPHSWLKDYIETNANIEDIEEKLSLHAFSVEKIDVVDEDPVYDVEITPNRGDALSILGIARELRSILPYQGFDFKWTEKKASPKKIEDAKDFLNVEIVDPDLVPRFSAIVLDNVEVKDSPKYIKERLNKVGIRPINNVVDITNYIMIDKGQPMHAFDFDKIVGHTMVLRESLEGEKITTLDGVERELPEGVIVIEDGSGKLIDLCGIMGGQNSEVDENTKKVLLFVQVYDPVRIRKASMNLGHRTDAALRFEKGIDIEGVVPSLWEAVDFLYEYGNAKVSSQLVDIINQDWERERVEVDYEKINQIAGVEIDKKDTDNILEGLGFEVESGIALVPSWRYGDILLPEDLAEEVVRIYGYHKLPNKLPEGPVPLRGSSDIFYWERYVKDFLKNQGFYESYNYSATSQDLAGENALALKNPLTKDFAYLRTSLLPQLFEVVKKNKGFKDNIEVFEIASTYHKRSEDLPEQPLKLGMIGFGTDYLDFKGVFEAMLEEMGVEDYDFEVRVLESNTYGIEVSFSDLIADATKVKAYKQISPYNAIKEDITIKVNKDIKYTQIEALIKGTSTLINRIELKDLYNDSLTLSLEYFNSSKQITGEEVEPIRNEIIDRLEKDLGLSVKTA